LSQYLKLTSCYLGAHAVLPVDNQGRHEQCLTPSYEIATDCGLSAKARKQRLVALTCANGAERAVLFGQI
jgi:hypothetical protein